MTMKKIYKKIGLLLSLVTLFTACDLDREPYDGIESEKLFSTVEGAQTALKGVYTSFQNYGYYHNSGGLFICPDILSDNLTYNFKGRGSFRTLYEMRYNKTENGYNIYKRGYLLVSRANNILDNLDNLKQATDAVKNAIKGEALALRAIGHFDVARVYCKIPTQSADAKQSMGIAYLKSFDPEGKPRRYGTTVDNTYKEIISDLETALTLMDDSKKNGQLNKTAVQAILSRVYLYYGNYQKAKEHADAAIADGSFNIAPRDQFANVWKDTYTKNVLFRILFTEKERIQIGSAYGQKTSGQNKAEFVCSYDLYQLYQNTDIRKSTTISTDPYDSGLYNTVSKYIGRDGGAANVVDGKYIRLEEVYLTRAEANYRLGNASQALADLDAVRSQRYSSFTSGNETGTALLDAILLERRLELAFEGDRFFTLKRLGLPIQRNATKGALADGTGTPPAAGWVTLPAGDYRWQLPIPEDAFSSNPNLTSQDQNSGY
jgi:putative outer membrane protein probably involved in nutrient binding